MLTITLLGSPSASLDGRSLQFGSVKAIALLAYLATSGMLHDRSELAALLWPESDSKRARGALRYTLSILKKGLGEEFLLINRRQIGMNPHAAWTADVVTLRRLVSPALGAGDTLDNGVIADVENGVAQFQADFLQGFTLRDCPAFNDWVFIQSETLRRDIAIVLKRLAAHHQTAQQWDTAVSHAHNWLNLNPLHEPAHSQLMQLYAELGDWTAVHNQYQSLTDLLELELNTDPHPETTALYRELCRRRETAVFPTASPIHLSPEQRSRHVLIEKVRRFWVNELLAPLRQGQNYIHLQLANANQQIAHPWADVLDTGLQPETANIYHAFRNADRSLLILGSPGAGKTITLIELCSYLLAMAVDSEAQPVPVVLNLSSWVEKQDEIDVWAVEEMVAKYQIPRRIGRKWLAKDRLLLLLDGLDEMDAAYHAACIAAINQFRQTHGLPDLVVCCRRATYETAVAAEENRLQLNGAILIQPLTAAQIRRHLPAPLADTVFQDALFLEIAQSPLNLNMMRTAFSSDDDPSQQPIPITHQRLFDLYVQRMLQRQSQKGHGTVDEAVLGNELTWLARQMQRHNQSLFLLEQIQPSWLANGRYQWLYLFASHALMPAVIGTLFMWSFVQLIGVNPPHIELRFLTRFAAFWGVTTAPWNQLLSVFCLNLFAGMVSAAVTGLFFLRRRRRGDESFIKPRLGWVQAFTTASAAGTAVALPIAITDAPSMALFFGGMAFMGVILVFGGHNYGQSFRTEIRLRGTLKWSWRNALALAVIGASLSLLWSGIIWLIDPTAVAASLNALNMGLLFFLLGGLSGKQPQTKNRPNEGIRIAGRNGLLAALVTSIPALILTAVTVNPLSGLYTGIMLCTLAGSVHGFNDLLKHYIVRGLLWWQRGTPLNYVRLLDGAADSVLLQKIGGGYVFRHRLLQDYFAQNEFHLPYAKQQTE